MNKKQKKWLRKIIIAACFFAVVFTVDLTIKLDEVLPKPYGIIFRMGLYLIIYLYIGKDVIKRSLKNIMNGHVFDENFLMVIATIGAFAISEFGEAVVVMLLFQVGEFFQSYAVGKSRQSITNLMDIRPDYANVMGINGLIKVDPSEVAIGDVIVVKPGEKIPLDGIIISGQTIIDAKALTGEAIPQEKGPEQEVVSGTINLTSLIEVKVIKTYNDSTVSKILELVENAQTNKSKSEKFITKFARVYTPIVVISAILLILIFGLITKDWSEWVYRGLNFLVVSCPCAVVISVPLAFFSGLGECSKNQILIKGSSYMEKIAKSNVFVLDKTGTITKGNFKVTKINSNYSDKNVLYYAAICEQHSLHPIAQSIVEEYQTTIDKQIPNNYVIKEFPGFGIEARLDDEVILAGNNKLMKLNNIIFNEVNEAGTVVYVSRNGAFIGSILIEDEIKSETFKFIDELNKRNLKSIMLTGDNNVVASLVASNLGITEFHSSLLPHEKVSSLEEIIKNKNEDDVVCFIGDGINDAPALTRSDVGFGMGKIGTDAAIEASDVVLMNDDLNGIIKARNISRKTLKIVKENIVFALGVKILVLILSALGITDLWIAVFSDVGVCILAILNSFRIVKK